METILVLFKKKDHDSAETAWPLSLRRTHKGDQPFMGFHLKKTLTMLSTGFRAQAYTPLLWQPTDWTQSWPTAQDTHPSLQEEKLLGQMLWEDQKDAAKTLIEAWTPTLSHQAMPNSQVPLLSIQPQNNQPLCMAAARIHASFQRCATTTCWPELPGPFSCATSHKDPPQHDQIWTPAITATFSCSNQ